MKKLLSFLSMCSIPSIVFAGISGTADKREVVGWIYNRPDYVSSSQPNNWNTTPYNRIVQIVNPFRESGTGEFIAPQYVLTNIHVAECCGLCEGRKNCTVITADGSFLDAKVVAHGKEEYNEENIENYDWAILEVQDYCSKNYFSMAETSTAQKNVWQAGFGALRILSSKDIANIRASYKEWLKVVHPYNIFFGRERDFAKGVDLAYGNYYINAENGQEQFKTFLDEYKRLSGKDFIEDCMHDATTLKTDKNCEIGQIQNNAVHHNCNTWCGDSGSSLQNSSNQIVGLHRGGGKYITGRTKFINNGPSMQAIFKNPEVKELLKTPCKDYYTPAPEEEDSTTLPESRYIGGTCLKDDLPSHALAGHYIISGKKKYDCMNGKTCSCAATQCEPGYYLVVNANGSSQGWCYKRNCQEGKHLNIIDNYKTDTRCVE